MCELGRTARLPKSALRYELDKVRFLDLETYKTLFNTCERLFIGNFIEQEHWRLFSDKSTSLTLPRTKRGTDLGTLVVPFSQTFPPITCMMNVVCVRKFEKKKLIGSNLRSN